MVKKKGEKKRKEGKGGRESRNRDRANDGASKRVRGERQETRNTAGEHKLSVAGASQGLSLSNLDIRSLV